MLKQTPKLAYIRQHDTAHHLTGRYSTRTDKTHPGPALGFCNGLPTGVGPLSGILSRLPPDDRRSPLSILATGPLLLTDFWASLGGITTNEFKAAAVRDYR